MSATHDEQLASLLERGEEEGCLNLSYVHELVQGLELDDEQVEGLYAAIEERHVELTDDCARPAPAQQEDTTYGNDQLAKATTDALQLSHNDAGL